MARPLRPEAPGAIWHVTSRGNERREIFRGPDDRVQFLSTLEKVVDLFEWRLHAYVLMENHYHLIVETPVPTLSRGMRQLNGVYTQELNRRNGRVGHLFQGRFKSILVEREPHLLELIRYVVLNPVRAKLVRSAQSWPWSSFRATAALVATPPWLDTDWTLSQFGRRRGEAARRYRAFVADGKGAEYDPWSRVIGQIFLGPGQFMNETLRDRGTRDRLRGVPRRQTRRPAVSLEELSSVVPAVFGVSLEKMKGHPRQHSKERSVLASVLRREAHATLRETGSVFDVGEWQASVLASRGDEALRQDPALAARLAEALEGAFRRTQN